MSTQTHRDSTILLRDQYEWTAWINQIQARAAVYNIWNNLNPEHPVPFLVEPTLPEAPEPSGYHAAAGVQEASRPSELSAQGQKAYKEDMEYYKILTERYKLTYRKYEIEQKSIQHLTALIQSTVAPHLQRTCCLPGLSLHQWITNLKNTTGVDDNLESERARARYHAALKPLTRLSGWDIWLAEYDQAATEAETYRVADVTQITAITQDFQSAVQKAAPIWSALFQAMRHEASMTRKEMMKRFREYMMTTHPLRPKHNAAFVIDEASYLADGGATTQGIEKDASIAENAPSRRAKPRNQPGKNPRKRAQEDRPSQGGAKCPACEQRHSINDCWYINTEQAPEWWKANKHVESLVELKKKHDATLIGALRGQSRARSQSLHIKKSQTPTPTIQELEEDK